uniref:Uncharacterized protein MANES_09G039700 n=1 Tax=Rhizophora mucronata TaxID=61149 RepID=A0A2P2MX94_RHIMU
MRHLLNFPSNQTPHRFLLVVLILGCEVQNNIEDCLASLISTKASRQNFSFSVTRQ